MYVKLADESIVVSSSPPYFSSPPQPALPQFRSTRTSTRKSKSRVSILVQLYKYSIVR